MHNLQTEPTLHIPEGINYECTGCGTCCGGWAVPMTQKDYDRISPVDWGAKLDRAKGKTLYRPLSKHEAAGTPYAYAIKEADDGYCPFLVNKLCFIHGQNGSKFKPSMCQLFPYCFNETPSGIYATVSFVSIGVLYNSGKALSEQRDVLSQKLQEFQALYPNHHPNWSNIKLTVGLPISWEKYLQLESSSLEILNNKSQTLDERLIAIANYLASQVSGQSQTTKVSSNGAAQTASTLKGMDKHLLLAFHKMYFPTRILARGEGNFSIARFIGQLASGPLLPPKLAVPGHSFTFEQLNEFKWPINDNEIDDLLYRYVFSRIFGKLYFGAGFGQLSLIAGFNHLALVVALIKLQSKALALSRGAPQVSLVDLIAAVRQVEKRLGETSVGPYNAAALELLLFSPQRVERVLNNSK